MAATGKNSTPWIIVAALVVLNLSVLGFLWMNGPEQKGPLGMGGPGRDGKEILMDRLEMTPEQREKYKAEYARHRKVVDGLFEKMRGLRKMLFSFPEDEGGERVNGEELALEIGRYQGQLELATFEHFSAVRQFLEPDQKGKFIQVFHELFGPRGRHGGPKGPPPPHRGGPPH